MITRHKGLALFLTMCLMVATCIAVAAALFVFHQNLKQAESFMARTRAYYLCETGASAAILDMRNGKIGTGLGQWTTRAFDFTMGDKTYTINYEVTKTSSGENIGVWNIKSWVDSPTGESRVYYLHVGGRRAFPLFIRGKP